LSLSQSWILGFDIGGTKTAVFAGSADGQVLARLARPSNALAGFATMWEGMVASADELIADRGRPVAIGVCVGGPLDAERGIVHSPPNLPGWDAIPLKDLLCERFGVPTYVEHDARAGALAEWLFGAGRGATDLIYLTVGTGLGAGLIVGGQLVRGATGDCGEVGHWRMSRRGPRAYGKTGSWEALSSGAGLPLLARYLYPEIPWPVELKAEDLVRQSRAGDVRASRVMRTSAGWLGRGISQLVDLLNPEIVVLGSMAVRAGDQFLPTVRDVVARECLERNSKVRIVASELGERLGDVSALCAAIYHGHLSVAGGPES
jgi:glucokinase